MYKFKTGDKGNTANGGTYVVLDVNEARKGFVLVAEITSPSGEHYVSSDFDVHGRHPYFPDLIPPDQYVWLNWYRSPKGERAWAVSFSTEKQATEHARHMAFYNKHVVVVAVCVKTEVPR